MICTPLNSGPLFVRFASTTRFRRSWVKVIAEFATRKRSVVFIERLVKST
jgi:hypothetical protein